MTPITKNANATLVPDMTIPMRRPRLRAMFPTGAAQAVPKPNTSARKTPAPVTAPANAAAKPALLPVTPDQSKNLNPAKNATHVRVIMTAAEAGNTAKEAFVPRTVLVAALTAKATTSPIPAAVITVPVTAITVTDIVRLNVSTLVLRHPAMEILTMKHPTFRLITIPAVPVFVTTTVIV